MKIYLEKYQKIWITSDTHYNHRNICRGVSQWTDKSKTRDFVDLEHMNSAIVDGINSKVDEEDILIHLGDWSFGGYDSIWEFRNRLLVKNIHIVTGNHDHHIETKANVAQAFTSVNKYLELQVITYQGYKFNYVLFHFPIVSWNNLSKSYFHFHGHVHLSPDQAEHGGKSMDVGLDGSRDFAPYDMIKLSTKLVSKPNLGIYNLVDHHENSDR